MKHADPQSLKSLAALLCGIRSRSGLVEKKPGIFYRRSRAFLHFHDDQAGLFMDIRDGKEWRRLPAQEPGPCLDELDRILATT